MLKKEKEGKDGGKKRNCQPNFDTFSSALVFLAIYLFIYLFFCCGVHRYHSTDLDD